MAHPPQPNPLQLLVSQFFGEASRGFTHENVTAAAAVRMIGKLQQHFFGRWQMAQLTQLPCAVHFRDHHSGRTVGCRAPMASVCVACQQPCCLDHASIIVESGDLICFACIELAKQTRDAKPHQQPAASQPSAEQERKLRRKYMRMLKLKGDPSAVEIRAAYKREAAKAHPDKHPQAQKERAQARFIELGKARDFLVERCEARAA